MTVPNYKPDTDLTPSIALQEATAGAGSSSSISVLERQQAAKSIRMPVLKTRRPPELKFDASCYEAQRKNSVTVELTPKVSEMKEEVKEKERKVTNGWTKSVRYVFIYIYICIYVCINILYIRTFFSFNLLIFCLLPYITILTP